jgi:hypothetical protein
MSESRHIVELKMERIAPPSFSAQDILIRRDRHDRRQRLGAVLVAFALFVPVAVWFGLASQDDRAQPANGSDTKAAFVAEASRICAWGREEFERVTPLSAPRGDWPFSRTVAYYRKGLAIFHQVVVRLRALSPPPGSERQVTGMIDLHERSIDAIARAVERGDAGDRHAFLHIVQRTFGPMDERLVAEYRRFDAGIDCP